MNIDRCEKFDMQAIRVEGNEDDRERGGEQLVSTDGDQFVEQSHLSVDTGDED